MAEIQGLPDPRYPIGTHLNLTAEKLVAGQDPKGMVMCFFRLSARIQIRNISVDRARYAAGHIQIPKLQPITIRPVKPNIPEWTSPEVA